MTSRPRESACRESNSDADERIIRIAYARETYGGVIKGEITLDKFSSTLYAKLRLIEAINFCGYPFQKPLLCPTDLCI